jgi:hypothetical protein
MMSKVTEEVERDWVMGRALLWVEDGKWRSADPAAANKMLNERLRAEGQVAMKAWVRAADVRTVLPEECEAELRKNMREALATELCCRVLRAATGLKEMPEDGWDVMLCFEVFGAWSKDFGFSDAEQAFMADYLGHELTEEDLRDMGECVEWEILGLCDL